MRLIDIKTEAAARGHADDLDCGTCRSASSCVIGKLHGDRFPGIDTVMRQQHHLDKGDYLFQPGALSPGCFIVRSGSIETCTVTGDGCDQVTGFYFPGEVISLEALFSAAPLSTAHALETSTACEIDCNRLLNLASSNAEVYRWMLHTLSKRLSRDERHIALLGGRLDSETRLAIFLRRLSVAYHEQGYSAHEFNLTMNRRDIGNYLGMSEESASRIFGRFQKRGLIKAHRKLVSILEPEKLWQLCGEGYHA